jgi:hypothetical protein
MFSVFTKNKQAMSATTRKTCRRNFHLFLTVAGTTGIAGLFLPFTFDYSPVESVSDENIWRLAAPFFLSVLITIYSVLRIVPVSFPVAGKVFAYIISAATAGLTLSIYFTGDVGASEFQEWLALIIPLVVLISGTCLVIVKSKKQTSREYNPLIAIQVAYLANCLMCLVAFWPSGQGIFKGGWQIGAYFALTTAVVYLLQIALFLTQKDSIVTQLPELK